MHPQIHSKGVYTFPAFPTTFLGVIGSATIFAWTESQAQQSKDDK